MSEMTRQQLCAELAVSESTVRRLELDGMPYTPVGRSNRYDIAECKAWLRGRKCQPGQINADAATLASWSTGNAFTEISRKVHLRVMPSKPKPPCEKQLDDAA
jgi:hypothetical protein